MVRTSVGPSVWSLPVDLLEGGGTGCSITGGCAIGGVSISWFIGSMSSLVSVSFVVTVGSEYTCCFSARISVEVVNRGFDMYLKSSLIVLGGGDGLTGVYCRRNFLFHFVLRPKPSARTMYWSNWRTSMTLPVLSHLFGWGPI